MYPGDIITGSVDCEPPRPAKASYECGCEVTSWATVPVFCPLHGKKRTRHSASNLMPNITTAEVN